MIKQGLEVDLSLHSSSIFASKRTSMANAPNARNPTGVMMLVAE